MRARFIQGCVRGVRYQPMVPPKLERADVIVEIIQEWISHHETFEVKNRVAGPVVVLCNDQRQLRNVMTCIAFPSNVERPMLVLREPLEPIH